MIKFIGIILIMLAGVSCGSAMSSKVKRHIAMLEAINDMFSETIMLMNFNAVTYPELIDHLKESKFGERLRFIDTDTDVADVRESILTVLKSDVEGLDLEESEKLYGFFKQFGTCDLEGQLSMAKKYMEYFSDRLRMLREQSLQKCRLYNSLGVLGGAFMAVILV